ncbi:MAG: MBG domain-containing protein [Synergistaceae bacterium]|nr:MBG domain-containing protein [Synergistaceae bacterium]
MNEPDVDAHSEPLYFAGLFGRIAVSGDVRGLTVSGDINITGLQVRYYTGGVAGQNRGTISNCVNNGALSVSRSQGSGSCKSYGGGVAGWNCEGGTVSNCENNGLVRVSGDVGWNTAGGVVGYNKGTIKNSANSGAVLAPGGSSRSEGDYAGGVVGDNHGMITDCANRGALTANGYNYSYAGGVAAENHGTITNSVNGGTVSNNNGRTRNYVGGVAGWNHVNAAISNCVNNSDVTAAYRTGYAGGVVGWNGANEAAGNTASDSTTITNCVNRGKVSSKYSAGGIAGSNGCCVASSTAVITNCMNNGVVEASENNKTYAGGVAGWNQPDAKITNCANNGAVAASLTGGGTNSYAGGIVGWNGTDPDMETSDPSVWDAVNSGTAAISNCANSGEVTSPGLVGGVAGWNGYRSSRDPSFAAITNCANSGALSGNNVGGVAWINKRNGTITNCGWLASPTVTAGIGSSQSGSSSSNVVSFDSTDNIVTTILPASRDITVSLNGRADAFVSYPGTAANMDSYFVSGSPVISPGGLVSVGSAWPYSLTAGYTPGAATLTAANAAIKATDFSTVSGGSPSPIADGYIISPDLSCAVTVTGTPADSVTISGDTSLEIGHTSTLTAVVSPAGAIYPTVTWSVSGDAVTLSATSGGSVTVTAAKRGSAAITVTADGGLSADCAVTVKQPLDSAVITIDPSADLTYSGTAKQPAVTVQVNSNDVDPSGYTVSYTNNINAGTAAVTITGQGYYSGTASADFTIQKKNVTIKANPQTVTYGTPISQGPSYVTATGLNDGASVTDITLTPNRTDFGTGIITPSAAVITANGANVTDNYNITWDTGSLTISPKVVTITPNAGQHKVYGDTDPTFGYTSSESGLTFTGELSRVSGGDVGNYAYRLGTLSAGSNYSLRIASGQHFEITAKAVTITANAQTVTYGTPISQETNCVTASGLNSGASVTAITLSQDITDVGTGAITPSAATITANGANVTANYNISYIDGTLIITAKAVTITPNAGQQKVYGDTEPAFSYTSSESGLTFTGGLSRASGEDVGNYDYNIGTLSAGNNYSLTLASGQHFEITAKAVTITANDQTVAYGTPISQGTNNVTASGLNSEASVTAITLTQDRTDAGTGSITPSAAAITASGANVTANYAISYINGTLTITPTPASPDVTEKGRTDGDNSGVLEIEANTTEDFAIYDALKDMTISGDLPAGISDAAKALQATSADVDTSTDIYTKEQIRQAVAGYWDVTDNSEKKIRVVDVKNTIATRTEETLYAKFWRMLVSTFTNNHGVNSLSDDAYLPLQTNFTITSADIAALPDELKNGLSADNLLERVSLFAVVSEDSGVHARSLYDAVSADKNAYITVSGDNDSGYSVHTRVMLFDMPGGVSGDKTTGAKWVKPLKVSNSQGRDNTKDNYFIVQDGASDDSYELCLAFAAKETNYATVNVTISGDITAESVYWTISGDSTIHNGNTSADIRGEAQSVTFHEISGYTVTLSDGTRTLSPDVMTISKDVEWGESWNITAAYARIAVEGVTLDRASAVLAKGDTLALTATVTPGNAYDKAVSWTSGNPEVATVSAGGLVTATGSGSTAITAAAGGQSASCTVTVLKTVSDDSEITVITPAPLLPAVSGENLLPVLAGYVNSQEERQKTLEQSGFRYDELATDDNGNLLVTGDTVRRAIADIESKSGAISHDHVTTLPVVTSSADQAGMIHVLGFAVSGDIFGEITDVRDIKVMKILPNGGGELFTVATSPESFADKHTALFDAEGGIVAGAVDKTANYTLTIFILDGGEFDLSPEARKVTDPMSILRVQPTQTCNSSNGCASGIGAIALLALLPLALWRRKK